MLFSLVVPVFNEEETLRYSFERIIKALDPLRVRYSRVEIIFVNDGSRDATPRLLRELTADDFFDLKTIHFSRNFGHSAAVFAGLESSKGDHIGIIDADLQDPPELLPQMLELLNQHDVVYGQRVERKQETAFKKWSAWAFYRILDRLAGVDIPADTGDFRVMTREVTDSVLLCDETDPFLRGLVAWVGFDQKAFPYSRDGRKFGETKYPFSKMLKFAMTAVVNFSDAPLRAAFHFGVLGLFLMIVISVWALYVHINGHTISGWTSLLLGFLLGQSITLIVVGIASHYVGRTFKQVQGRPRYIVRRSQPR